MKIGIVVSHPTQFEGPLYRYASAQGGTSLRVIYTDPLKFAHSFDPEMSREIQWGIDLTSGYDYVVMPKEGSLGWLANEFKSNKYDLVIVNGYSKVKYLTAIFLAKIYAKAVCLRVDSVSFSNTSKMKLLLKKIVLTVFFKLFDTIFSTGSLSTEYLVSFGVDRQKISIFSYAIDVEYFKSRSNINQSQKETIRRHYGITSPTTIVTCVAKFNDREAPWDLLYAVSSQKMSNLSLLLVGDGPQRKELENFAIRNNITAIFPGYVQYTELPLIYGISDIFIHPSKNEPWGVSVAEAMACGLPVICSSRVGSAYDLVDTDKNGFIYQTGNHLDLTEKLLATIRLLHNKKYREYNDRILSKWDYSTTWNNIVETCRSLTMASNLRS